MRLTPDEIAAIKDCAARHFGGAAVVRLFGSRTDDKLRGGDIDLHIIASAPEHCSFEAECDFLRDLIAEIGDQRVDTLVQPPDFRPSPIDHIAMNEGVIL